jgi:hypothetical protein
LIKAVTLGLGAIYFIKSIPTCTPSFPRNGKGFFFFLGKKNYFIYIYNELEDGLTLRAKLWPILLRFAIFSVVTSNWPRMMSKIRACMLW